MALVMDETALLIDEVLKGSANASVMASMTVIPRKGPSALDGPQATRSRPMFLPTV